jgi:Mce-associated membrane protein
VVRGGEDRAEILLFVNRPTTNKVTTEPVVYKDQATLTMELVEGEWLVDDVKTSPAQQ